MKKVHRVLSGVLVLLALAAPAGAQVSSSVLQGVVTDAQGGVLPGVTVVITNVDTGLTREVSSDAAGFFRATALPPGPYAIQVRLDKPTSLPKMGRKTFQMFSARILCPSAVG